eukprot:TRINITY_DN10289_c0_g1_i1.p1 TRINITY_DN10289_c0_g1~~TRINITY_DN10289_c0_g1_i1.p1  ORF type:complete len:317 (+),score=41.02 TRINITY_DN10289_c0_g1_i1:73-1023(+)
MELFAAIGWAVFIGAAVLLVLWRGTGAAQPRDAVQDQGASRERAAAAAQRRWSTCAQTSAAQVAAAAAAAAALATAAPRGAPAPRQLAAARPPVTVAQAALHALQAVARFRQQCGTDAAMLQGVCTLLRYARSIDEHPLDPRYRLVKGSTQEFRCHVGYCEAGTELMELLGFVQNDAGDWELPDGVAPCRGTVRALHESQHGSAREASELAELRPGELQNLALRLHAGEELGPEEQSRLMLIEAEPTPAGAAAVARLRTAAAGPAAGMCTVCGDSIEERAEVATLPCGDSFHHACIARWLGLYGSACPHCRRHPGE